MQVLKAFMSLAFVKVQNIVMEVMGLHSIKACILKALLLLYPFLFLYTGESKCSLH